MIRFLVRTLRTLAITLSGAVILGTLVLAFLAAGCGGADSGSASVAPLPLWQRVLVSGDVARYVASPEPPAALDLEAFVDQAKDAFVRITPKEAVQELKADGFADAMIATLTPAGLDFPVVASTVIQLGSAEQAQRVLEWAYTDSTSPCPNVCNVDIETFDVPEIPGAKGIRRSRTFDSAAGGPSEPFESFEIEFVNGPFLYDLLTLGAQPGQFEQDDLIAAAQALYERVKGSPPLPTS